MTYCHEEHHPALQVIGIAPGPEGDAGPDAARHHDRVLAELNEQGRPPIKRPREEPDGR